MTELKQYRGSQYIKTIVPIKQALQRSLMGPFLIEFETQDEDIFVGDLIKLTINGEEYTFEIRETSERKYKAEHISYKLMNYAVIDKYLNNPPTYESDLSFTNININSLTSFLNSLAIDFGFSIINNSNNTDLKDISFSNDNILSAIQKIADIFNVEFRRHDNYIEFVDQVGETKNITVNAGIEVEKITKKIDKSYIVSRIYPQGKSDNLPEGYYYKNLKPTTFDINTKQHTGNLYLEKQETIDNYGVIEKTVEFDIGINNRKGTIEGTGEELVAEYNKNFPYIYDNNLSDIDENKAKTATLVLIDGLLMAELRIIKVSAADGKIWYSKTLKDGTELSWTPSNGSTYILLGYISQVEVDEAVSKLQSEAQKYLDEHSSPKIEYSIQKVYLKDMEFDIGDTLTLLDNTQGINTAVRVLEYKKDLMTGVYNSIKLSNSVEKIPIAILKEQIKQKQKIKKVENLVSQFESTAREALERHNLLVNNNFYGSENEYVLIGSAARNYVLNGIEITPDYNDEIGRIKTTQGQFQVVGEDVLYTIGSVDQTLSPNTYFIYIQIDPSDSSNSNGNNKIIFSPNTIKQLKETYPSLDFYALGMCIVDGSNPTKIGVSYGFTLIDGNFIKTGTIFAYHIASGQITADKMNVSELSAITANVGTLTAGVLQSSDGKAKFDLTNGNLEIYKDIIFNPEKNIFLMKASESQTEEVWNGYLKGILTHSDSGDGYVSKNSFRMFPLVGTYIDFTNTYLTDIGIKLILENLSTLTSKNIAIYGYNYSDVATSQFHLWTDPIKADTYWEFQTYLGTFYNYVLDKNKTYMVAFTGKGNLLGSKTMRIVSYEAYLKFY